MEHLYRFIARDLENSGFQNSGMDINKWLSSIIWSSIFLPSN